MDSLITSGYCKGTERWSASLTSTARCFMYAPKSNAPSAAAGRATKVSAVPCTCSERGLGLPWACMPSAKASCCWGCYRSGYEACACLALRLRD